MNNGYIVYYGERQHEVRGEGLTQYEAKLRGIAHFKPPKSKQHLVSAHLAEVDGKPVVLDTASLPGA